MWKDNLIDIYKSWENGSLRFSSNLLDLSNDRNIEVLNMIMYYNDLIKEYGKNKQMFNEDCKISAKSRTELRRYININNLKKEEEFIELNVIQDDLHKINFKSNANLKGNVLNYEIINDLLINGLSQCQYILDSYNEFLKMYKADGGFFNNLVDVTVVGYLKGRDKISFSCINLIANNLTISRPEIMICISGYTSEGSDQISAWSKLEKSGIRGDFYYYDWCALKSIDVIYKDGKNIAKSIFDLLTGSELSSSSFIAAKHNGKVCGKMLAYIIASEIFFNYHTVTLIGFSLGTHVIKHCIKELEKLQIKDVIENVILLAGASNYSNENTNKWVKCYKQVVNGRCINVHSDYDSVLKFAYKQSTKKDAVGYKPKGSDLMGVLFENKDISDMKLGHTDYRNNLDEIFNTYVNL